MPALATRHNWNRLARGALDSWQISGITRYQTGSPLVPTIASISCHDLTQDLNPRVFNSDFNECGYNGNKGYKPYFHNGQSQFSGGSIGWYGTNDIALRPIVNWSSAGGRTAGTHWVNPYSSLTLPGVTNFGTFETPIMRGPGLGNYDFTLFKSFPFGESRRVEFRLAAFDIFNHANPQNPNMGTNWEWDMPANLPQTTANAFSLGKPKLTNPGSFGYIQTAWGHREVEAAIKIYF